MTGEKPRILFVDEEFQCLTYKIMLEKEHGYQVDIVESLKSAKDYLSRANYSVVIMEPFNGDTFTQRQAAPEVAFIKQVKKRGIPVVLSTTQEVDSLYNLFGLTQGSDYDAHVFKPHTFEELRKQLDDLLQQTHT